MTDLQGNVAGFIGMACVVFAYAYQTGRTVPNPFVQHGANLLGAVLLSLSLLVHMNLASFILEIVWGAVAIWGLVKAIQGRRA